MTSTEVARALGCARKTVDTARLRGQLKATRTGTRHWVYDPTDVANWDLMIRRRRPSDAVCRFVDGCTNPTECQQLSRKPCTPATKAETEEMHRVLSINRDE